MRGANRRSTCTIHLASLLTAQNFVSICIYCHCGQRDYAKQYGHTRSYSHRDNVGNTAFRPNMVDQSNGYLHIEQMHKGGDAIFENPTCVSFYVLALSCVLIICSSQQFNFYSLCLQCPEYCFSFRCFFVVHVSYASLFFVFLFFTSQHEDTFGTHRSSALMSHRCPLDRHLMRRSLRTFQFLSALAKLLRG